MKVAIYARISTKEQDITTQLSYLQDYCKRNDLEVVAVYKDVGQSGSRESRPEFDTLLYSMRAGEFEGIVVYKLDRIGRSLSHLLNLFEEFKNRKVAFISATQNIRTDTAEGRMFLRMLMVLAEYERELIVSRINDGLDRARKQGKKLGRPKGKKDSKPRRKSGYYLRHARGAK